jgi:hypothetical protein
MRSALLAADLVLIPVQPSPLDGWASAEMLALLSEARIYRPQLAARFVLNRCGARTVIARETAETLADHDPPVLAATIGQRVAFADTPRSPAASCRRSTTTARPRARSRRCREIERLASEARAMSGRPRNAASPPGPAIPSTGSRRPTPACARPDAAAFTARLTIDVTPELRGRIKIAAFRRGVTVADMLRDLLAREFPPTEGDPS